MNSVKELSAYIGNSENGLIHTKRISNIQLSATYLPSQYLALNEQPNDRNQLEKIKKEYDNTVTILFNIAPSDQGDGDIMYQGVSEYKEYTERMYSMNFSIGQYFTLNTPSGSYKPVLSNLENTYSLKNNRKITLVFAPNENEDELIKQPFYDIVYEDEILGTGMHHFRFTRDDINNIPEVNYKKIFSSSQQSTLQAENNN